VPHCIVWHLCRPRWPCKGQLLFLANVWVRAGKHARRDSCTTWRPRDRPARKSCIRVCGCSKADCRPRMRSKPGLPTSRRGTDIERHARLHKNVQHRTSPLLPDDLARRCEHRSRPPSKSLERDTCLSTQPPLDCQHCPSDKLDGLCIQENSSMCV
jgi:hypothetical protein